MSDASPPFNPAGQPPVGQSPRKVSFLLGLGIFLIPLIFAWFTLRQGYSTMAKVISFGWLVLSLIMVLGASPSNENSASTPTNSIATQSDSSELVQQTNTADSIEPAAEQEAVISEPQYTQISAFQLFTEYQANEVAGDRKFKGQQLLVSGTVDKVESDISNSANVHLSVGDEYGFNTVIANGDSDFDNQAAELSKGQQVVLNCTGGGELIGSPVLDDCRFT